MSDDTSKPLDAGTFFDPAPPSAWSWAKPALFCIVNIALVVVIVYSDAGTARSLGASAYAVFAGNAFMEASVRYAKRSDALRREDHARTAKRTREWIAFFRKWRERREKRGE